jgi:hypothetical protein
MTSVIRTSMNQSVGHSNCKFSELIHSPMMWIKQAYDSAHNSETSGAELYN